MLYMILIFLVALAVFIGMQVWGARAARKVDRIEEKSPERALKGAERAGGEGQAEGIDPDPGHGVSSIEAPNPHGWKGN
jgi:hypothetical protein